MEASRQKIGFDVQIMDLTRRHPPKALAGLAILATLALAACGPEEPVAVADAEGTMVGQSPAAKQESWTGTGAYLAGTVAFEQRDMRQAADLLTLALGDNLDNGVLAQKTLVALMSDGRIEDAIKLAHRMQDAGVRSILVSLVLMQEQAREGDYEDALKLSRELPDDRLMQVTAPMLRAWLAVGAKGKDAGIAELKPLTEIDGAQMLAQMQTALITDHAGDSKKAAADLLAAIDEGAEIPAQLAEFYVTLALRNGDEKAARAMVERYRTQAARPRRGRRHRHGAPDRATQAQGSAGQGPQAGPGDRLHPGRHGADGGRLQRRCDVADASRARPRSQARHRGAGARRPASPGQSSRPGDRRLQPGAGDFDLPPALAALDRGIYRRQEKFAEAEALLRKLMDADKTDISAAQQLGQLLRSNKKFEEAAKVYGVAIDRLGTLEPEDWQLFYYRGISYERAKQWPPAEKDFQKALELSPDEPYVLNYLAYTWVERRENLDQALGMLEKAVSQRPEEGFIIDSLGWAHFMLGRYPEAVEELERAVALAPTDPVLNDHLGDAYWKVGRHQEARFQWSRALSFDPEPDQAPKLQQKLDQGLVDNAETAPEQPKVNSQAGSSESGG